MSYRFEDDIWRSIFLIFLELFDIARGKLTLKAGKSTYDIHLKLWASWILTVGDVWNLLLLKICGNDVYCASKASVEMNSLKTFTKTCADLLLKRAQSLLSLKYMTTRVLLKVKHQLGNDLLPTYSFQMFYTCRTDFMGILWTWREWGLFHSFCNWKNQENRRYATKSNFDQPVWCMALTASMVWFDASCEISTKILGLWTFLYFIISEGWNNKKEHWKKEFVPS